MNAHPVSIPAWTPEHRKLPAHTLCLSHVKHNGRRRCLAVPEAEAPAYLAKLDRFAADIAKIVARHRAAELLRPKPRGKGPKRIKPTIPQSKLHRHQPGSACLTPIDVPGEDGWFTCTVTSGAGYSLNGYVHEHRTKRGRRFLTRHLQGERSCPATIARREAELADELEEVA